MGLPAGTVTFLFTDVEGSTRLLHELGNAAYADALAEHRAVLRDAFSRHGGVEVDTQGDAFFVAFPTAPGALEAAAEATAKLDGAIRVRIGIHTGTPLLTDEGYVGVDVHRAARIASAGHGGQTLVSATTAELTRDARLVDLGEHRLKDLSRPERIFQLGAGEFQPLKTLYRTNLPVPATPFLGRDDELAEVARLLDSTRLLTLTGPGGTGKTRLALQAAAHAADAFPDGVFWVPLAPLRDGALVAPTVATTLGLDDLGAVGDKRLLLLLDNFEHVVDAAPVVTELLAVAPHAKVLVTSRELLRVPGEQAYAVPPLVATDAEELFSARARALVPDFQPDDTVRELCERLDSLPLAVELAAARVQVLPPAALLERLGARLDLLKGGRGADERQQTLRATIEWSHDLLDAGEAQLFARLTVFAGGCTLESAENVCDADVDTLQSLVDKSLVRVREGPRFWMLETIREFGAERLEASGEAITIRRRHADQFLADAEELALELRHYSRDQVNHADREIDNFLAASSYLAESGDVTGRMRLVGLLTAYWVAGHAAAGRREVESALAAGRSAPAAARAPALVAAAFLAISANDVEAAYAHSEEAVAASRELGEPLWLGSALNIHGIAVGERDGYEHALPYLSESVEVFAAAGDVQRVAARRSIAFAYARIDEFDKAIAIHRENLAEARSLGIDNVITQTLGSLASLAIDRDIDEAAVYLRENLERAQRIGMTMMRAQAICRAARLLTTRRTNVEDAVRLLNAYDALQDQISTGETWVVLFNESTLADAREVLGEAAFDAVRGERRVLELDDAIELALSLL